MDYLRWYADNIWLFVPVRGVIKELLGRIPDYPFQTRSSLIAAGINYNTLRAQDTIDRTEKVEDFARPGN